MCACACVCASSGARQFTAYILAVLRRTMQRDGRAEISSDTESVTRRPASEIKFTIALKLKIYIKFYSIFCRAQLEIYIALYLHAKT